MARKKIRAEKNTTALKDAKPNCRLHGGEMKFDPATMRWVCTVAGCGIVAYPKHDDQGRPITGRGALELVYFRDRDGDPHIFLRAVDNNVMLDITSYMLESGIEAETHDGQAIYGVHLVLERVTMLDKYGRKTK